MTTTTTTLTMPPLPEKPAAKGTEAETNKYSRFRTLLPQIIASTGKNLLLIDLGLAVAFPTIVIPALRGLQPDRNPNEALHFTVAQASWFGSLAYILKPIGSALSGWVSERIGRKRAMLLVNVPHIIGWPMLYFATSTDMVFASIVLLGLGVGFMEAPVVTYVGEICEPSIRGILVACSGVAVMLGFFLMYLLGALMNWRNVALLCTLLPIITSIAISFLPETPLWLLSKGRVADAQRSLQWLRGWVPANAVATEFAEMQRYSKLCNSCIVCQKAGTVPCPHPPAGFAETARELRRKRTLRPFALIMFCFVVAQFSGMHSIRPYMVQIFAVYGVPVDPNWTTVLMGVMSLVANVFVMCTISVIGKRKLIFFSLAGTGASCFALSAYAYNTLPLHQSSFEFNSTVVADTLRNVPTAESYFPMIMFLCLALCTSVGAAPVPWMFLSEVFPFKTRGLATGLTAALNYCVSFVSVKSYLSLETTFTISGSFLFFGIVSIFGFCILYPILPETEGRTLEEIEQFFSDNKRPITDRHVRKIETKSPSNNGCDNVAYSERL